MPCLRPAGFALPEFTTYALAIEAAWGVDFLDGTVGAGDKGVAAYARAVRGGL